MSAHTMVRHFSTCRFRFFLIRCSLSAPLPLSCSFRRKYCPSRPLFTPCNGAGSAVSLPPCDLATYKSECFSFYWPAYQTCYPFLRPLFLQVRRSQKRSLFLTCRIFRSLACWTRTQMKFLTLFSSYWSNSMRRRCSRLRASGSTRDMSMRAVFFGFWSQR